jgi:murein DD-endopeptidase MepM/ murein hydrolase activator NlpD
MGVMTMSLARKLFAALLIVTFAVPATARDRIDGSATEAPIKAGLTFLWPAEGRVVVGFCFHPDAEPNYGLNLAVSPGSDVRAAEAGEVIYTGDELKGYHNLILIRHSDGWFSAYARADEVLVARGDHVSRGQVIAQFAAAPDTFAQLHFELRHGRTQVDPGLYLQHAKTDDIDAKSTAALRVVIARRCC